MGSHLPTRHFSSFADPSRKLGPGDIVVVGAGLAGLFTALKLAPLPVTVIAAAPLGEGASSAWAQGGIAAAVGPGDRPDAHARDTILAGAGIVDPLIAGLVAADAPNRIRDLAAYGVEFDRDANGRFALSREAAHSANRIVRVAGDRAGTEIMQALIATVRKTLSIRVLEGFVADGLVVEHGRVTGVRLVHGTEHDRSSYELMPASAVVLATGGIGSLYAVTTNPAFARGEALAFAARAGAVIADAEFVQFHPTAFDVGADPAPLATEALRGEGATLINNRGERFMTALHRDAELAPRDIVARGVASEIAAGRGAFLDCRTAIGARIQTAYPTVSTFCAVHGIDPTREPIPVAPAAHYHMGGIATDENGRTSVEGLWAVGEVASTGLHGANRLASNSLLEGVVFGARAASDISSLVSKRRSRPIAELHHVESGHGVELADRAHRVSRLRSLMSAHAGVVRDREGLKTALRALRAIETEAEHAQDRVVANMALAARFIVGAALVRTESRGGHFRSDFPDADPGQAQRSFLTRADLRRLDRQIEPKAAIVPAPELRV